MSFQPHRPRTAMTLFAVAAVWVVQSAGIAATRPSLTVHTSNQVRHTRAFMTPDAASGNVPILFVSDARANAVNLYNANTLGGPIGTITDGLSGGPAGMAVDGKGNLYVVVGPGVVEVYAPGALHPSRTIALSGRLGSVAAAADGTVATFATNGFQADGTLYIFDKGSLTPTRTIDIPIDGELLFTEIAVTIDASDNVFVSVAGYPHGDGDVAEFVPGSTQPVDTALLSGVAIGFDAAGNYYTGLQADVNVFAPGSKRPRIIRHGISVEAYFTVLADGTLFVPNITTHRGTKSGNVVKYLPGQSRPAAVVDTPAMNPVGTAYRPTLR